MEKRKGIIAMTIIGIVIIIIAAVFIKFEKGVEIKEEDYLKENIIISAKKCIKEEKCAKNTITIGKLLDNGYLSDELTKKLEDYSKDSFVTYPGYEVKLIEISN